MKNTLRICTGILASAALFAAFPASACDDQASADSLNKKLGMTPSVATSAKAASTARPNAVTWQGGDRRGADRRASGASRQSPLPQPDDNTLLARYHSW